MLDDSIKNSIKEMVFKYLDPLEVKAFIFGSRAIRKNRNYSDIDLGFVSKSKIPIMVIMDLEEEFDRSNLPFKVDLVDFASVSDDFKKNALKKVVYLN